MLNDYLQHIRRLRTRTIEKLRRRDVMTWLEENTTVNGMPFSTKDHEYQWQIGTDESREIVVRKCSQVGLSELSIRIALGLSAVMEYYDIIYTFPTATFAGKYVKTRIDPVIQGSPFLRNATSGGDAVDSSEVKKIGENFVYFNGAASGNAAISVAADMLIHDELDFSDQVVISQYTSRLTHSPHKHKILLSTPTVPDGPIDDAFKHSRRFWNVCKCNHCSRHFIPDYYEHVKIPDFDDSLETLTKANLHKTRYQEAVIVCPHCGGVPSMQPEHREWICENPTENYMAVGYQVQPFDAPNLIALPDLIKTSTMYERPADFKNFSLGLPAEDASSKVMLSDLNAASMQMLESPFSYHFIGADMGLTCHVAVGGIAHDGALVVVHMEQVPIADFRRRYAELCNMYNVTIKVIDSQPYVETVLALQEMDYALYGAVFSVKKGIELYDVRTSAEDQGGGTLTMRQVDINKPRILDKLMGDLRDGLIKVRKGPWWDVFVEQMQSMKRVGAVMRDGEIQSQWVKTDGNDHYHMALTYLWVASKMRYLNTQGVAIGHLGLRKFRNKTM